MKKFVVETTVKELNDEVENILSTDQFVQEITEAINVTETEIAPNGSLTFETLTNGKGAKSVRIVSDIPLKMSYTSQANTYNFGCYMKEITLLGDNTDNGYTAGFIAKQGNITLQNADADDTAHLRIIYTY